MKFLVRTLCLFVVSVIICTTIQVKDALAYDNLHTFQDTTEISLTNGQFVKSASRAVFWLHIHANARIIAPQDGSVYFLQVIDGNKEIYSAQNIQANQELTLDYQPGFSMNARIRLNCTSNPQSQATLKIEYEVNIG
jgi:hypothetical protein